MFKWLVVLLLFWFLYFIREVFPPFIVGSIFAYLLLPLVNQVSKQFRLPPAVAVAIIYIGAAVVTTFMVGGSSVGVCGFPATHASIMSAHSCSM